MDRQSRPSTGRARTLSRIAPQTPHSRSTPPESTPSMPANPLPQCPPFAEHPHHRLHPTIRIRIIRMRMKYTGTIHVPLPPTEALELFTPEGERDWVPGWDPHHHSPTVF